MARQADHPHIMAEIFAAELRADANITRQFQHLLFHLDIAEGVAGLVAAGRQGIQPLGGGELHGLQRLFRAGAADDDGQMIRRAGGGAERLHLGAEIGQQLLRRQYRPGFLEQEGLVGRPAALGNEHQVEFVGMMVTRRGQNIELHRQIVASVHFLEHGKRRHLRIAQIGLGIGAVHAVAQRLFLVAFHPDALALLAEHDGGARILAHRQHAAGGDVGVLQQIQRHEPVIGRCLGVIQDFPQLRQMCRAQQVGHVVERPQRQFAQRVRLNAQHGLAVQHRGFDARDVELLPNGLVRPHREHRRVEKIGRTLGRSVHGVSFRINSSGACGGGTRPG